MKALVVSDSHQDLEYLSKVVKQFASGVDLIIHLGDGAEDVSRIQSLFGLSLPRTEVVRGNCDSNPEIKHKRIIGNSEYPILLTHGHIEGVKQGKSTLVQAAKAANAKLVLFGHTHQLFYRVYNEVTVLNPGSISQPRNNSHPSFAILTIDSEKNGLQADFYEIEKDFTIIKRV